MDYELRTMWWGYLHSNGNIQVKRWFGDHKDYTDDCEDNDFVVQVVKPFAADNREQAMDIIAQQIVKNENLPKIPQPDGVRLEKDDFHFSINYNISINGTDMAYAADEFRAKTVERALKYWLTSEDAKLWWKETLKKDGYNLNE